MDTPVTDLPTVDRLTIAPGADSDTDGLPDDWEQTYFGSATAGVAAADPDLDGLSNWQEYVAGTSPTDRASTLVLLAPPAGLPPATPQVMTWSSVSNRFYTVYDSTNLLRGFTPRAYHLPATTPFNYFTNTAGADVRFFRIGVD